MSSGFFPSRDHAEATNPFYTLDGEDYTLYQAAMGSFLHEPLKKQDELTQICCKIKGNGNVEVGLKGCVMRLS